MLITILLGIAAGIAAPHVENPLKRALSAVILADAPMSAIESRLLSFAVCLFGAAVLAALLGGGSAVALALGAVLGVFGPRVVERYRSQ